MPIAARYYADMLAGFSEGPPPELTAVAEILHGCVGTHRTVYTFGNGASAALAAHMACDLGKGSAPDLGAPSTTPSGPRLRIVSLADNAALTTAYGNDVGYDSVFVEPLKNLARSGDVVIGISGSGGSPNVLRALEYARTLGLTTVGLTGRQPAAQLMAPLCDVLLTAPSTLMEQIEDFHVTFGHVMALELRALLGTAPAEHAAVDVRQH